MKTSYATKVAQDIMHCWWEYPPNRMEYRVVSFQRNGATFNLTLRTAIEFFLDKTGEENNCLLLHLGYLDGADEVDRFYNP